MDEDAAVEETTPPAMLPIVFGPAQRPMLGFYHAPATALARAPAVVLCSPLGYEAMSVHRTYRHLAERLAARGVAALRFDYDGTGDSVGRSDDPDRLRAWIAGILAALAVVRARAGQGPVALFGVRFGATLAALAAAEDGRVESLVAWAPVLSGRVHVREIRAFRMIKDPRATAPMRKEGGDDVGGYFFSAETLAEMSKVDLLGGADRVAERVLVLSRSERSSDEPRLVEHLAARGADARLVTTTGYLGMMRDDPYESVVPDETLDVIVGWILEGERPPRRAPDRFEPGSNVMTIAARDGRSGLRETPLLFGPDSRLFGVLTEPEAPGPKERPALCLLNVGANQHVGPHRMNVELARALGALGYVTFRFDAAGLGDSRAAPGARENRIYTKDSIADVKSAMSLLARRCDRHRFVLVGLCSGAYLAFHTTLDDARVVGQLLLSPYAFEWQEGDPVAPTTRKPFEPTGVYARAALDPHVWRRMMRGEVNVRPIARVLFDRAETFAGEELAAWSARLRGRPRPRNEVERAFGEMCDRGVETLVLLTFDDGGVDMVARYLGEGARKMRGRKGFSYQIVGGGDHAFMTMASQKTLRDIVTGFVTTRFP